MRCSWGWPLHLAMATACSASTRSGSSARADRLRQPYTRLAAESEGLVMASAYLVDTSRSLVLSKAFGTLTDDDLLGHVRALRADATFHSRMFQIADFRDVV